MAEKTIDWLHRIRAQDSTTPWFAYVATGCSHAPHHVPREWSDKYKGAFDEGWDVMREQTFARQKELGVVPADTELTTPAEAFEAWDTIDETRKRLSARQMEVYAGYSENCDWNIGRIIDAIEEMGELDNTLVLWIWGDNGASMEGTLTGTFNEMTTLNGIPLTVEQQMGLLFKHGGLEAWGGDALEPHYSSNWALASNTPFQWGKQVASHLGGTRNPLVVRYPSLVGDAGAIRSQFTHVTDIGPTVLDLAGIPAPDTVDGIEQQGMDGFSFTGSLSDGAAAEHHTQQYFEALGNRAMYKDGWWFCQRPERIPWELDPEVLRGFGPGWDPDTRPGRALLPSRRLLAGEERGRAASREGRGAPSAVLGGGRAQQRASPPRGAQLVLRDRPAAPEGDEVHVSRADREHRGRRHPADLQPLVHDLRRSRDPRRAAPKE